jgi:CheY-like chemotaxis protein
MNGFLAGSRNEFRDALIRPGADAFLAALLADENDEAVFGWLAEEREEEDGSGSTNATNHPGPAPEISRRTVLVVDDDDLVRATVSATMEEAGYEVVDVSDGKQAMALLERSDAEIAALISDIRMPGIDGLELARTVARKWPHIAIVLVSGYPPGGRMNEVPDAAVFVSKPFRLVELAAAVARALAYKDAAG